MRDGVEPRSCDRGHVKNGDLTLSATLPKNAWAGDILHSTMKHELDIQIAKTYSMAKLINFESGDGWSGI